jgi:hypothetical protein
MQMASDFPFLLICFFSDNRRCLIAMCLGLLLFQGCALLQQPDATQTSVGVRAAPSQPVPVQPPAKKSPSSPVKLPQTGEASWYGAQHQGKQTASGTIYDQARLTAAHPSLPFGSKIKGDQSSQRKIGGSRDYRSWTLCRKSDYRSIAGGGKGFGDDRIGHRHCSTRSGIGPIGTTSSNSRTNDERLLLPRMPGARCCP